MRSLLLLSVAVAVALAGNACGHNARSTESEKRARGGTLHAALLSLGTGASVDAELPGTDYFLDPQRSYDPASWELFRCCLLRTLLSYNGHPTAGGGADLKPDLAASMPQVSRDGMRWTFTLKQGLHYAPPFETTEITARDIVRALKRDLSPAPGQGRSSNAIRLSPYRFYYEQVIVGARRYADGNADSISGLETPDEHTLVVHLLRPTGDLGYRLSLPGAAPIPPSAGHPGASLGAAAGHGDGYGRFLVGSGPYMLAGSEKLDFSLPAAQQKAVSGYVRGKALTFVRNPSWDARTDSLRRANVDKIEFRFGGTPAKAASDVDHGRLDLVFDSNPPVDQVRHYLADPRLKRRAFVYPGGFFYYIPMNLAIPPFDDVHVRKAVSYAINKAGLVRLANSTPFAFGPAYASVDTHIAADSVEGNLLQAYDPYATPGHRGDIVAARREMSESRYDRNHDGVCDSGVCRDLRLVVYRDGALPEMAALVRDDLDRIGLGVQVKIVSVSNFFEQAAVVRTAPLGMGWWYVGDYPSGSSLFQLFSGPLIGRADVSTPPNVSLVGATPEQLRQSGYPVTSVPSVDSRIADCQPLAGPDQVQCWASLDQYMMEKVVPWVPYFLVGFAYTVSARVTHFTYDQFTGLVALEQIALGPAR